MTVAESIERGVIILRITGDVLGGPEAQEINERLRHHVRAGNKHVVLDVSDVGVVNSSGLGLLIAGLTIVRNAGGELRLANPSSRLRKLLEVTKLAHVFPVDPSVDAALAQLAIP
ncbi:MAG: STAS domain-containing protein [candidate division KSB1 bacterium]|nr:STAS domain-containing protein [candidate division KSB1 bacterium]